MNNISLIEEEARKKLSKHVNGLTKQFIVELRDNKIACFLEGIVTIKKKGEEVLPGISNWETLFTFEYWTED